MVIEEVIKKILYGGLMSSETWLELEEEVLEWIKTASKEERQRLIDSGAFDQLEIICSGIRYELKHRVLFKYDDAGLLIDREHIPDSYETDAD